MRFNVEATVVIIFSEVEEDDGHDGYRRQALLKLGENVQHPRRSVQSEMGPHDCGEASRYPGDGCVRRQNAVSHHLAAAEQKQR